ncbi:hypothetical protein AQUCO_07700052v1 [Aquilegia coerulea]|uniref:Uncharacterized protein n=1 Tax=Aquilegia coerulea TaxID=218851 RepID=A0A2G5C8D0_AQUCA|nr:hypothetical protein AQUCO_07700052v1 [Aquilegia coerulea]
MMYKTCTKQLTSISEHMATTTPVEIGTRGTVGSLVLQEIEHFSKLAMDRNEASRTSQKQNKNMASTSHGSREKFQFVIMNSKKKKRGNGFLPSMCSMVDVAETSRPIGNSGFNYRSLKADVKKIRS